MDYCDSSVWLVLVLILILNPAVSSLMQSGSSYPHIVFVRGNDRKNTDFEVQYGKKD